MSDFQEQFPDLKSWVAAEPDAVRRQHKAASRIILEAVAASSLLKSEMIMKGGVLLAIRYGSERFTRDIDFSTPKKRSEFDEDAFLDAFQRGLATAVDELEYGIDCRIQSWKYQPPGDSSSFPTMKLKVGFAQYGTKSHRQLEDGRSPLVVPIDFSFNEPIFQTEQLPLSASASITAYSYAELVAEKFRAILQQETRGRVRRQDAYDLCMLFTSFGTPSGAESKTIHEILAKKAHARGLELNSRSMDSPRIRARSARQYPALSDELPGDPPPFEEVYELVRSVYLQMPWKP